MSELINSKSRFSEERVSEIKEIQRDISVKRLRKKKDIPNSIKVVILIGVKNERERERKQGRKMSRNNGKKSLNLVKTKTYVLKNLKAPQ